MTNDNDLIRRGDALAACQIHNSARSAEITIAAMPAAAPAVTVKPLVWRPDTMKGSYPDRMKAIMPCGSGDYSVAGSRAQGKWQWFRNGYFVDGHQLHAPMSLDAAKVAAQADYEARILSALTLTPASPEVDHG